MRKALAIIALGIVTTIAALIGGGIDGEIAGDSDTPAAELALRGHGWG